MNPATLVPRVNVVRPEALALMAQKARRVSAVHVAPKANVALPALKAIKVSAVRCQITSGTAHDFASKSQTAHGVST